MDCPPDTSTLLSSACSVQPEVSTLGMLAVANWDPALLQILPSRPDRDDPPAGDHTRTALIVTSLTAVNFVPSSYEVAASVKPVGSAPFQPWAVIRPTSARTGAPSAEQACRKST